MLISANIRRIMSRSRRKRPFFGFTSCRSERADKKTWHPRWRARERTALASASPEGLEAHLPVLENQITNPWRMGKDGRAYYSRQSMTERAEWRAAHKGRTPEERALLEKRELHKLTGK